MHPPLHRPHPDCQDVIKALEECHENHPFGKLLGYCNTAKADLDRCFHEEKLKRVRENPKIGNYLLDPKFFKQKKEG